MLSLVEHVDMKRFVTAELERESYNWILTEVSPCACSMWSFHTVGVPRRSVLDAH